MVCSRLKENLKSYGNRKRKRKREKEKEQELWHGFAPDKRKTEKDEVYEAGSINTIRNDLCSTKRLPVQQSVDTHNFYNKQPHIHTEREQKNP